MLFTRGFHTLTNRCQLGEHIPYFGHCRCLRLLSEPCDLFLLGYVLHRSHNQRFKVGAVHRDSKPFPTTLLCLEEGIHLLLDPP